LENGIYVAPEVRSPQDVSVVAASQQAFALSELQIVPAPAPTAGLIAVATYYSGIALHGMRDFSMLGLQAFSGAPAGVAMDERGNIYTCATDGSTFFRILRDPWGMQQAPGVPLGNEVAFDSREGSVFVSNRDVGGGRGALTRIRGTQVTRVETGITAEGLALDERRHRIFVGNVNDASVTEIDTRTLGVTRTIPTVARTFGIAVDPQRNRLFAVSNQDREMHKDGGFVVLIDLAPTRGRIIARSAPIAFPLGAAYDVRRQRLFVTDEDSGQVYVLSATTLRREHAPLRACAVPWLPHLDQRTRRLYVPCARANKVAVFDADSLLPIRGTPFATGAYPLSVATPP